MKTEIKNTSIFKTQTAITSGFDFLTGDTISSIRFQYNGYQCERLIAEEVVFEFENYGLLIINCETLIDVIDSDCLVVYDEFGVRFEIYLFYDEKLLTITYH
jgi:hypothetical protein